MKETDVRFPCGDPLLEGIYFYRIARDLTLLEEAAVALFSRGIQRKGV